MVARSARSESYHESRVLAKITKYSLVSHTIHTIADYTEHSNLMNRWESEESVCIKMRIIIVVI